MARLYVRLAKPIRHAVAGIQLLEDLVVLGPTGLGTTVPQLKQMRLQRLKAGAPHTDVGDVRIDQLVDSPTRPSGMLAQIERLADPVQHYAERPAVRRPRQLTDLH